MFSIYSFHLWMSHFPADSGGKSGGKELLFLRCDSETTDITVV